MRCMVSKTKDFYNENAQYFFHSTYKIIMNDLYDDFLHLVKKGGKILDLGCGSGRDLLFFKKKGFKVTGIDFSDKMVKFATEFTNEPIIQQDIIELSFEDDFDGIWACASLLHFSEANLKIVLGKMLRALKTDGIIYMSFKYGFFDGVRNNRYFCDYTEEKLTFLLNHYKQLKIVKIWLTPDRREGREKEKWLNCLVKKQ